MKTLTLQVNEQFKKLIPALTKDEYRQLESNILEEGIRDSICVWDGFIIDGHNRYQIASNNDLDFNIKEYFFDEEWQVKDWMINNQLGKRNLTEQQKSYLRGQRYNNEKLIGTTLNQHTARSQNGTQQKTKDKLAEEYGVSKNTILRDAEFADGLDKIDNEELRQEILQGTVKINKSDIQEIGKAIDEKETLFKQPEPMVFTSEEDIIKRAKELRAEKSKAKKEERKAVIQEQVEAIENGTMPEIDGKFHVIAIDPPWNYGRKYDPDGSRIANPYPEMTQNQLKEIDLPSMDDSVLWLWTTHQFIFDAKELMEHWGYTYKATMVWDKEKMGMGAWLRMQCEFCLLGVKGKPVWDSMSIRDIIREPRREHSRKPDKFYDIVSEVCVGRKLEYFSREKREGWEVFGNDTDKF